MRKFTVFVFGLLGIYASGQHFDATSYPKGIYETYEDFRAKKPSSTPNLSAPATEDQVAFRFTNLDDKGKKVKKAFAISDGKNLYVHIVNLIKKFNSEDSGQAYDGGIYYLKAENHGGYMFLRDYFVSNGAAMWGGLIAAAAARRSKGVIYEEEKESFNLFKNVDDFKKFMEINFPNIQLDLEKGEGETKLQDSDIAAKNLDKINKQE